MNSSLGGGASTEREAAHRPCPKEVDAAAATAAKAAVASQADKDVGDGSLEFLIGGSLITGNGREAKALNNIEEEIHAATSKEEQKKKKKEEKKRKRLHHDHNAQNEGDLDQATTTATATATTTTTTTATNSIISPPEINRAIQPEISNDNHQLGVLVARNGGCAVEPKAPPAPAATKPGDQIPVGIKQTPSGKWEVQYRYKTIHHPPIYIGTFHTIQAATAVLKNVREEVETKLAGITRTNFSASQLTNTIHEAKTNALEKAQRQLQILLTGVLKEADTGKWVASYYCQGKWFHIGTYDTAEDAINAKAMVVAQLEPNGLLPWDDEVSNEDAQSIFEAGRIVALGNLESAIHASLEMATEATETTTTCNRTNDAKEPDDLLYVSFSSDASEEQPDTFRIKLSECTPCTCTLSTDGRETTCATIDAAKQPSPNHWELENQMRKTIHECLRSIHQSITKLTFSCTWAGTSTLLIKDMKKFEAEILSKISTWDKVKKTFGCFESFLKKYGFHVWHTKRGSCLHTYIYHIHFRQDEPDVARIISDAESGKPDDQLAAPFSSAVPYQKQQQSSNAWTRASPELCDALLRMSDSEYSCDIVALKKAMGEEGLKKLKKSDEIIGGYTDQKFRHWWSQHKKQPKKLKFWAREGGEYRASQPNRIDYN